RRLYTLKGQQTFDEIKRKYDLEPEFRTAVDRYIGYFEKGADGERVFNQAIQTWASNDLVRNDAGNAQ
ncbi:hypothetical protein ACC677_37940, partial [Rhizobium ruizarguesonis]